MREHTLIYDGDCAMCTRWMERVRRWDRDDRIETLPLQSPEVESRFPALERAELMRAMHFVEADGTVTTGARAAERMLHVLPMGWGVRWLFHLPFARPIADRIYRSVADNRARMGCGEHCSIGGGE